MYELYLYATVNDVDAVTKVTVNQSGPFQLAHSANNVTTFVQDENYWVVRAQPENGTITIEFDDNSGGGNGILNGIQITKTSSTTHDFYCNFMRGIAGNITYSSDNTYTGVLGSAGTSWNVPQVSGAYTTWQALKYSDGALAVDLKIDYNATTPRAADGWNLNQLSPPELEIFDDRLHQGYGEGPNNLILRGLRNERYRLLIYAAQKTGADSATVLTVQDADPVTLDWTQNVTTFVEKDNYLSFLVVPTTFQCFCLCYHSLVFRKLLGARIFRDGTKLVRATASGHRKNQQTRDRPRPLLPCRASRQMPHN